MRKNPLMEWLRRGLEGLGIPILSRPALHGIDRRLALWLPKRAGWFLEAGANDGFQQSNTYYLERFRGWRGVLIEPEPQLAAICRKRRPAAQVIECALGPPGSSGTTVQLRYAGLMTAVRGTLGDENGERERAARGLALQGLPVEERMVTARIQTLTEVLREAGAPREFDLLSIDVEGYEVEALKGLDFALYLPIAICAEVRKLNFDSFTALLGDRYELKEILHEGEQHGDYLWMRTRA